MHEKLQACEAQLNARDVELNAGNAEFLLKKRMSR